jgi:hypothetical protein
MTTQNISPARELAIRNSAVLKEAVDIAQGVLRSNSRAYSLLTKNKVDIRCLLQDIVCAVSSGADKASSIGNNEIVKDEAGWIAYLKNCKVLVRDPEVGMSLIKGGLSSAVSFSSLIGAIASKGALVVSLEDYPGIKLFKKSAEAEEV